jgi:hypothetical protein
MPLALRQYSPCVAFDPAGALHVVWHGRSMMNTYQQVFHREYGQSGWSGIDSISGEQAYQQEFPSIACDAAGRCHAVWLKPADSVHSKLLYVQREVNDEWSSPIVLTSPDSGDVRFPSIVCEADSGVHVVWSDASSGNPDVYYLRGAMPGAGVAGPRPSSRVSRPVPAATIIRGVLNLQPTFCNLRSEIILLSVDGRRVMDLKPGANDVRALAPGVYFVRGPETEDGRPDAAIRKVVVTD